MNSKQEQIFSLAKVLTEEKAKYPNHLLNDYRIHVFSDSVGLENKRTGKMLRIMY